MVERHQDIEEDGKGSRHQSSVKNNGDRIEQGGGGGWKKRKKTLHKMCLNEIYLFSCLSSTYSLGSSGSISIWTICTWGRDTVCHAPTRSGGNLTLQYTSETGTMNKSQMT